MKRYTFYDLGYHAANLPSRARLGSGKIFCEIEIKICEMLLKQFQPLEKKCSFKFLVIRYLYKSFTKTIRY